ncbi:hypothetical protein Ccrd_003849 [Cynara cardunculus var. scolymus]|uniref:Uncharacterized protein n=1 Tax=Cynara cardunculus var. scolymus TaxID=59895 RepID=A0A118JW36_CYNCS|nr:hypothetical protein Ccrd_003849 [Cynara cardunculus var. scolymus]
MINSLNQTLDLCKINDLLEEAERRRVTRRRGDERRGGEATSDEAATATWGGGREDRRCVLLVVMEDRRGGVEDVEEEENEEVEAEASKDETAIQVNQRRLLLRVAPSPLPVSLYCFDLCFLAVVSNFCSCYGST